jgi:glycerol-3-phosphate dehydrogenase (NAD(P)+)
MPRIAIIGNTSWGKTLGALLADRGVEVGLWARNSSEADELNQQGHSYCCTSQIAEALAGVDLTIWAVPSQTLRENVRQARDYLTDSMLLMSAAKGLEVSSGKRMSEVLAEEVAPSLRGQICVLSGPNLAKEISQGLPAASVIAARNPAAAERSRRLLESSLLALCTSDDVVGVELGGALKNIIALGAGVIDGLELGDNAKGAFIAWGWSEVISLGAVLGARASTFCGLAGLGDLFATCSSVLSRNYHLGYELARGRSLSEIAASMQNVAEGVTTTLAVHRLSESRGLELPVIDLVYGILHEGLPLSRASIRFSELAARHP